MRVRPCSACAQKRVQNYKKILIYASKINALRYFYNHFDVRTYFFSEKVTSHCSLPHFVPLPVSWTVEKCKKVAKKVA